MTFITGHGADGNLPKLDWYSPRQGVAHHRSLHGAQTRRRDRAKLIAAGRSAQEPAAIVSDATIRKQNVVVTTLEKLGSAATASAAPAIIVIGENVRLREGLDWLGAMAGRVLEPYPLGRDDLSDVV